MARKRRLTKKQKRMRLGFLLVIVSFLLGVFVGYSTRTGESIWNHFQQQVNQASHSLNEQLSEIQRRTLSPQKKEDQIHILDVGQGSAVLLQAKSGENILIDSGRHDDSDKRMISYLDQMIGTGGTIDLAIFTHTDSDHIGHADLIFDYYDVKEVWSNGKDNTTQIYFDFLTAIKHSGAKYVEPKAGEKRQLGDFTIDVLHPVAGQSYKDQNEASIIGRIQLNDLSFMFSGDASYSIEDQVIESATVPLKSDLLLVGHHGSKYSTGRNWLKAVQPDVAFFQAGKDNMYGHPHSQLKKRLKEAGIPLYGTIDLGTISIYIDDEGQVNVETEKAKKAVVSE